MEEMRKAYKIRVGKSEWKVPRHKLEKNIKLNIKGVRCEDVGWIYLA
jgi:hypothetical protein